MALFSHFVQVQTSEQTLFNFLILGKSRFPPKKFLTSTTGAMNWTNNTIKHGLKIETKF